MLVSETFLILSMNHRSVLVGLFAKIDHSMEWGQLLHGERGLFHRERMHGIHPFAPSAQPHCFQLCANGYKDMLINDGFAEAVVVK
jgi:hypothetical protein